jgi:site-specific DNA-methyltransferase (adenine-specific)
VTTYRLIEGDCRASLRTLPAESVQTCVTSPPYFGLRDYGHDGQIGLETTPDEFVAALVAVFREVRRVLKDDGTLWLNLGDSYGSSKQLLGVPWRVAFALQADGWYLRQDIIWHKPTGMPESVKDRCTKSHEYIFLLSKSPKYLFNADAIAEPIAESTKKRCQHVVDFNEQFDPTKHKHTEGVQFPMEIMTRAAKGLLERGVRNRRSVWTVPTRPYRGAHFATFPPKLIEPCVLAGSREGDTVIDPFNGAGTTGLVAIGHGRHYIGCELNSAYIELTRERLRGVAPLMTTEVVA